MPVAGAKVYGRNSVRKVIVNYNDQLIGMIIDSLRLVPHNIKSNAAKNDRVNARQRQMCKKLPRI